MEVRYKREMNHNYMIMDAPSEQGRYECQMLSENTIEGLLKFRMGFQDGRQQFYYEITSRQPLSRILERRKIRGGEIRRLMLDILAVLERIEKYLLKGEQLLLNPEYLYVDPDSFRLGLCLVPGRESDLLTELSALLRFLLEKVDHEDRDGVVVAYNLYQESLKENYGACDLMRHLMRENDKDMIFRQDERAAGTDGTGQEYGQENGLADRADKYGMNDGYFGKADRKRRETERENGGKNNWENSRESGRESSREKKTELCSKGMPECQKNNRERKKRAGRDAGAIGKNILRFSVTLAGAEGILWYLLGEEGLERYGIWTAAGILLLVAIRRMTGRKACIASGESIGQRDVLKTDEWETQDLKSAYRAEQYDSSEEDPYKWEIHPESMEEYQKNRERREEEELERSREEGTVLLTKTETEERIGVLEPLNQSEKRIVISYVPFIIGKNQDLSDYALKWPEISRLHLRIDKKEGVCIVTDLNSTNGTAVNGYQLQANETVSIKSGDFLYLAGIGYQFVE